MPYPLLYQIIPDNRRGYKELAEAVKISKESIYHILTEELDMRKLIARWVGCRACSL